MKRNRGGARLMASALAAVGASACCVVPLILIALGIGGSWVADLTAMAPYRPIFVGLTVVFLGLAFRRLYRMPQACEPGTVCANPRTIRRQRPTFWLVAIPLLGLLAVPSLIPLID
ncbi:MULTISPECIES: mercuric transporter MerT family protein [Paraburkholderia]|uniref:mercuric transporter MerT family protein n=1 Tax=Paraburkholderia TaxID=1822464 RepID=UPI0003A89E90|nr:MULTISPECIES: mercuric transporter MerT family protein [Paraburkholderia]MDH6153673.1 mercuric ion transport protein [Paraburkholderia sp. WSM4179]